MSAKKLPEFAEPPAIQEKELKVHMKPPMQVVVGDSLETLQCDDLQQLNNMLNLQYLSLMAARDIDTICKVSTAMTKLLVERRKLLCLQYGHRDSKAKGGDRTFTVDD